MRATEFIVEAAYDGIRDRLLRQHPEQAAQINAQTTWAKNTLVKPDRVIWWLKYLERMMGRTALEANELHIAQMQLTHLMSIQYQPIQDYVFGQQSASQVVQALRAIEAKYKERTTRNAPVELQQGDRVIQDFGHGLQWVYTNRAYCPDEGRSGKHCGNVVGQDETDQRIISLRKNGHVQLTFILEPNGELGEMKGVGNNKPSAHFHPYIIWLLKQPFVKGIRGGGYAPSQNFSIRDLNDQQIADLKQARPDMDIDRNYYTQVLAISEQNKSIIQEILAAIDQYQQETTGWTWFTKGTRNGSDDVEDFIEYADIMAEYEGDEEDAENTYSFSDIPNLMGHNLVTRLDHYDDSDPAPFEALEQMEAIFERMTVSTQITAEHRKGSWTLAHDGERIKTGRFRF